MQQIKRSVLILTQDSALSKHAVQADVVRLFSDSEPLPDVILLHYTKKDKIQKLNAQIETCLNDADQIIILDADKTPTAFLSSLLQKASACTADILCRCDASPSEESFASHRNLYTQYLCRESTFWSFSENAVRRIHTADTTDYLQEALTDKAVSVSFVGSENAGSGKKIRLLRCIFDVRRLLIALSAVSLTAAVMLLLLTLIQWSENRLIGCIVCANLFFACLGALLIRWYRNSAKLERKKREHPYVEESLLK